MHVQLGYWVENLDDNTVAYFASGNKLILDHSFSKKSSNHLLVKTYYFANVYMLLRKRDPGRRKDIKVIPS